MMKKNVTTVVAVAIAVVLATGCGQKATASKTPEVNSNGITCDRADDPVNRGDVHIGAGETPESKPHLYDRSDDPVNSDCAVGTGQTTGSDRVEFLGYGEEFDDPEDTDVFKPTPKTQTRKFRKLSETSDEATKPHEAFEISDAPKPLEVSETRNTPRDKEPIADSKIRKYPRAEKPIAGVPNYEDTSVSSASASIDFGDILKGMGASEIRVNTLSKESGNTVIAATFNGVIAEFYFETPVEGQGIALTRFSVHAATNELSVNSDGNQCLSSWCFSRNIEAADSRSLYYEISQSDFFYSDTDHGKEKLLLPMEISDLLDKNVAPYLQESVASTNVSQI